MDIKRVAAVFFSPTGSTQKIVLRIAEGTGIPFQQADLTLPEFRRPFRESFGAEDLVVVGLPVYVGRLPGDLDDFFAGLNGNSTPAAAVVVYGNRDYNDALIELRMRLEARGFVVRSAAAFVAEHTVSSKIAMGRPDANDLAIALDFGRKTADCVKRNIFGKLELKGDYPFTWNGFDPNVTPDFPPRPRITTGDNCTQCKLCARNCPWAAIDPDDSRRRDYSKCMICQRCLKNCPSHAIQTTGEKWLSYLPQFEERLSKRREPELFLPY